MAGKIHQVYLKVLELFDAHGLDIETKLSGGIITLTGNLSPTARAATVESSAKRGRGRPPGPGKKTGRKAGGRPRGSKATGPVDNELANRVLAELEKLDGIELINLAALADRLGIDGKTSLTPVLKHLIKEKKAMRTAGKYRLASRKGQRGRKPGSSNKAASTAPSATSDDAKPAKKRGKKVGRKAAKKATKKAAKKAAKKSSSRGGKRTGAGRPKTAAAGGKQGKKGRGGKPAGSADTASAASTSEEAARNAMGMENDIRIEEPANGSGEMMG